MKKDKTVIGELEEKATPNQRHYRKNDGTKRCVIANTNLNYYDEEEKKWKHTDNRIEEKEDCYEARLGNFKARLPKNTQKIEVTGKGKSVSWEYLGTKKKKTSSKMKFKNDDDPTKLLVGSEAEYKDVDDGVDIQYVMRGNNIKENIIVNKARKDYKFRFAYQVQGLELRMSEDKKKIEFYSNDEDKLEFTIPAPYMYDLNRVGSSEVHYEVEKQNEQTYIVTVVASKDWINAVDRAFPVTIDPQLTISENSSENIFTCETALYEIQTDEEGNIVENYMSSSQTTGLLLRNSSRKSYGFIRINTSNIWEKSRIIDAKLLISPEENLLEKTLNCSIVADDVEEKNVEITTARIIEIPIGEYIKNSEEIIVKLSLKEEIETHILFFDNNIAIVATAVETNKKQSTRKSFALSNTNEEIVDLFTGESVTKIVDTSDENIGIEISHILKESDEDFCCGENARLNIHERLIKNDSAEVEASYIYTDALGDKHYLQEEFFYIDSTGSKVIVEGSNVSVLPNGDLEYVDSNGNIFEVQRKEATFCGIKATTKLEGVKNIELFEQRVSEQKELCDRIEAYETTLDKFKVFNIEDLTEIEASYSKINNLEDNEHLLTEEEIVTLKGLIQQEKQLNDSKTSIQNSIQTSISNTISELELNKELLNNSLHSLQLQNHQIEYEKNENGISNLSYPILENQIELIVNRSTYNEMQWMCLILTILCNKNENGEDLISDSTLAHATKTFYIEQCNDYVFVSDNFSEKTNINVSLYYDENNINSGISIKVGDDDSRIFNYYNSTYIEGAEIYYSLQGIVHSEETYFLTKLEANQLDTLIATKDLKQNGVEITTETENGSTTEFVKEVDVVLAQIENVKNQIAFIDDQLKTLSAENLENTENKHDLLIQKEHIEEQLKIVGKQIELLYARSEENVETFKAYYKELVSLQSNLEEMKIQIPVNYILTEEIIKCFNEFGDLVAIYDKHNNYIIFEYESYYANKAKKHRVSKIYDKNENEIRFAYDHNDLLEEIIDSNGRRTYFEYSNQNLSNVIYPDTTTFSVGEQTENIKTYSAQNKTVSLTYDNKMLTEILITSHVSNIGHETMVEGDNQFSKITFIYSGSTVKVLDENQNGFYYSFDENLNIVEAFQLEKGLVTFANEYAYNDEGLCIREVHPKKSCLYVDFDEFDIETDYTVTYSYDKFDRLESKVVGEVSISETLSVITSTEYFYDKNNYLIKTISTVYELIDGALLDADPDEISISLFEYNSKGLLVKKQSYVVGEESTNGIDVEEYEYSENGYLTTTIIYNSLDPSSKYYSEQEIDENGQIIAVIDACGMNKTSYYGNTIVYPNGGKFSYGYDSKNGNSTITQSTKDGEENSIQRQYTNGLLTRIISDDDVYDYSYDYKGRVTEVKINGDTLTTYYYSEYEYEGLPALETCVNYNNHSGIETARISNRKYCSIFDTASGMLEIVDYSREKPIAIEKTINSVTYKTTYTYDEQENLTNVHRTTSPNLPAKYDEIYQYNENGKLANKTIKLGDETFQKYQFDYNQNSKEKLTKIQINEFFNNALLIQTDINLKTDALGRKNEKNVVLNNDTILSEQITYLKHGDHTTNLPQAISYGSNQIIKYKYDIMGNICEIRENDRLISKYTYDSLNRLAREDNKTLNQTIIFEYDNKGNILSQVKYPFTLKNGSYLDEIDEANIQRVEYAYENGKLVSYNGSALEYDEIGNPTLYKENTLAWIYGRRLASYGANTFEYDFDGSRLRKNNTVYIYDNDGRLIRQGNSNSNNFINFIYDESGVAGFLHSSGHYFYKKDILGNIIEIIDITGATVVKYIYDAWGNHKVLNPDGTLNTEDTFIGNINPIRYRSYYYDVETGLYYLYSRYYDPDTGRFISMDDINYLDPETIGGTNLYAYCNNNPVMYVDPTGKSALAIILGIIALAGLGLTIGGVASDNNTLTAIGLTMVAIPALISGVGAIAAGVGGATLTGIVGGVTTLAGVGTGLFASAEYQEAFTGNNWMLDAGMSESWYNGLMLATATIATVGTFASSFMRAFKIKSINKIGKLTPSNHPNEGYFGIRFKNNRGALRSIEFQNHAPHGVHLQLNSWNPKHMSVSTIRRWKWFLTKM